MFLLCKNLDIKKEQKMETTNDVLKDTGSSVTWVNEAQWVLYEDEHGNIHW